MSEKLDSIDAGSQFFAQFRESFGLWDQQLYQAFSAETIMAKPIQPSAAEVRAITEREAERMIEMNDDEVQAAVTKYAEDFGTKAAAQLER